MHRLLYGAKLFLVLKNDFLEANHMSHTGLLRRYLIFFAGVLCSALGISLITLAGMGTSAVSSLAYVLTYVFPGVSLGTFTFVVN